MLRPISPLLLLSMLLAVLLASSLEGAEALGPAHGHLPTSYVDDFTGPMRSWARQPSYRLTQAGGVLTMRIDKHLMGEGEQLDLGGAHDVASEPWVTVRVRASEACILQVYLQSGGTSDMVQMRVRAVSDFVTLSYDMSALRVDLKHVDTMIFCVNGAATYFAGTVEIKDLTLGHGARLRSSIEGVDDVSYYHDAGPRSVRIFGIAHASRLSFQGAATLIGGVTFSAIDHGRSTMCFQTLPGACGHAVGTITAHGVAGYLDNDVSCPITLEPNYPPTISSPPAMTALVGRPQVVRLLVDDGNPAAEQPLDITVSGGGPAVPARQVRIDHARGSVYADLSFTPRAAGTASLVITVDDHGEGKHTAQTTLDVRCVAAWNLPPTLDAIADATIFLGERDQAIPLSGISDGDGSAQPLRFTVTSADPSIVHNAHISYAGKATATLHLDAATKPGTTRMRVILSDQGGRADNNGDACLERDFQVTCRVRPQQGYSLAFSRAEELRQVRVEDGISASVVQVDGRGAMQWACTRKFTWGGVWIAIPPLDLTAHPVLTMEVKPDDALQFNPVLFDGQGRRNSAQFATVALPAGAWTTVAIDLSGSHHLEADDGAALDPTWITTLLVVEHPTFTWPFTYYTGKLLIRNLAIGRAAQSLRQVSLPSCTLNPIPSQAVLRHAGRLRIPLQGLSSGQGVEPAFAIQLAGDAVLGTASVERAHDRDPACIQVMIKAATGRAAVTVEVTAPGSLPLRRSFSCQVLGDAADEVVPIDVDCSQQGQTLHGLGTFYSVPVSSFAADLGGSAVRIGCDSSFLSRPDTSDLQVINRQAYHMDALNLELIRQLKTAGVETFFFTSWSPPAWMKPNHSVCGQEGGYSLTCDGQVNILDYEYYEAFAKLMVGLVRILRDETGVDLYAIGLQNEPCFHEPYGSAILDPRRFCELVKVVGRRFQAEGITTRLIYSEHMFNMMHPFVDALNDDLEAQRWCQIVAVHGYDDSGAGPAHFDVRTWSELWARLQSKGVPKELWMTEMSPSASLGWPGALTYAATLAGALTYGHVSMWTSFVMEGQLLQHGQPDEQFAVMRQFYAYLKPGAVEVSTVVRNDHLLATSCINDAHHGGALVTVIVNSGADAVAIDLRVRHRQVATWQVSHCDAIDRSTTQVAHAYGQLVVLPAQSVTTLCEHS